METILEGARFFWPGERISWQSLPLPLMAATKKKVRFEVTNGYKIKSFSLEILKQKVAELLGRDPIHDFERMRDHLLLPQE